MRSFEDFLKRIASRLLLSPQRLEAVAALDPSHIYVENVRALFGVSTTIAKRFCDIAERQGILERRIEVRCPDQSVAAEAPSIEQLPDEVLCWEELDGESIQASYATLRLNTSEFYVLTRESTA